ncbi:hypothetical protein MPNT_20202 [Candidatus Methylacidithermus pantelleriae]|uniref:Uncharacterized protein n=1 Tax=Candidatus Methylacidithermus pantelleriae TaxID=2744239 RepID=A0A8J2FW15_9BACT|nr:hypothetical protein MPNT_20202 [Candidatus Methylacidithermus pantelleriae]
MERSCACSCPEDDDPRVGQKLRLKALGPPEGYQRWVQDLGLAHGRASFRTEDLARRESYERGSSRTERRSRRRNWARKDFRRNGLRSVKVRLPEVWVERIGREANSAGGRLVAIDPWKTRRIQF